jgi:hypothetical protein
VTATTESLTAIREFTIPVTPEKEIEELRARIEATRWPDEELVTDMRADRTPVFRALAGAPTRALTRAVAWALHGRADRAGLSLDGPDRPARDREGPGSATSNPRASRPAADHHHTIRRRALLFGQEDKDQAALVDAVRSWQNRESVIDALCRYPITRGAAEFSDAAEFESFLSLARDALDLCEYVRRVLDRQKDAVAAAIA